MAVAKVIELSAGSKKGIEDAVEKGVKKANSSLNNVTGVWVKDIECVVEDGKIAEWRVGMKVTFVLK